MKRWMTPSGCPTGWGVGVERTSKERRGYGLQYSGGQDSWIYVNERGTLHEEKWSVT